MLVIDDDPLVRRTLSRFIQLGGHSVTLASGLREGKAALRSGPFDVVLTDIYMPDADGIDALSARTRRASPSCPCSSFRVASAPTRSARP